MGGGCCEADGVVSAVAFEEMATLHNVSMRNSGRTASLRPQR